jgi:hypothetical protein
VSVVAMWYFAASSGPAGGGGGGGGVGGGGGGGSGPDGAPTISLYAYSGGTRYGIAITAGDAGASTELERDGVVYSTGAGSINVDVGLKSGDGSHTWRARHFEDGSYSSYSNSISTLNGEEV